MALLGRQAADVRSIVGRQSFITLSVDRLSIDTRQEDQTPTVDRPSMTLDRLSLKVGRTSVLQRPTLDRLSTDYRSTISRLSVDCRSTTDATYNTHDPQWSLMCQAKAMNPAATHCPRLRIDKMAGANKEVCLLERRTQKHKHILYHE